MEKSNRANRFSTEVRAHAVRMIFEHEHEYANQSAAIMAIAPKIGCGRDTKRLCSKRSVSCWKWAPLFRPIKSESEQITATNRHFEENGCGGPGSVGIADRLLIPDWTSRSTRASLMPRPA
jgi:hypothetical protein